MIFQIKLKLSPSARNPNQNLLFQICSYDTMIHRISRPPACQNIKKKGAISKLLCFAANFVAMNPLTVSGEVTSSIILGTSIDSFAFIKKARSPQQAKTKHLIFIVGFTVSPADCDAPILCFNLPRCFIGENGLHRQAYFLRSSPYRPVDNMASVFNGPFKLT